MKTPLLLAFLLLTPTLWSAGPADEPVVKAVEKTLPAVVNINTEAMVDRQVRDPFDLFFERYATVKQKVRSLGSGVLISPEGYIVTNDHVAGRAQNTKIQITLSNGSVFPAKFLSSDPDKDLALIKIDDKKPFPFLDLNRLSPNLLGQTVIALGNPIGFQNSVSQGILSQKNRTLTSEGVTMEGLLQTDAAINPGNSGGALVDCNGDLVGINSAKQYGQAIEGIGFAIPGDVVAAWAKDAIAIAKGEKKAPEPVSLVKLIQEKFGFTLQSLTPELAETFGYNTTYGLLVADVEANSPAEKAGAKKGMLLVRIGNLPIMNEASLPRDLQRVKKGDKVVFTLSVIEQRGPMTMQRSGQVELQAR
jgi:S1-C subfamily serine protease